MVPFKYTFYTPKTSSLELWMLRLLWPLPAVAVIVFALLLRYFPWSHKKKHAQYFCSLAAHLFSFLRHIKLQLFGILLLISFGRCQLWWNESMCCSLSRSSLTFLATFGNRNRHRSISMCECERARIKKNYNNFEMFVMKFHVRTIVFDFYYSTIFLFLSSFETLFISSSVH